MRLHLDEPAARTLEIVPQLLAAIQLCDRHGRRQDQLHAAIVELVDERDEAARLILERHIEARHVGDEHGLIEPRQLDVVVLAARAVADVLEIEPDDAVGRAAIRDLPAVELERASVVAFVGRYALEEFREARFGYVTRGRLIDVGALERA